MSLNLLEGSLTRQVDAVDVGLTVGKQLYLGLRDNKELVLYRKRLLGSDNK